MLLIMRNNQLLRIVILSKGILMVLLGIVHIIFGITYEHNRLADTVPVNFLHDYLIWFMAVGIFITFIGTLDLLLYYELKYKLYGTWKITFCTAVFTTILGACGTLYFREGPPILIFILGIIAVFPILLQKKDFKL